MQALRDSITELLDARAARHRRLIRPIAREQAEAFFLNLVTEHQATLNTPDVHDVRVRFPEEVTPPPLPEGNTPPSPTDPPNTPPR
jgi:hypothetical protein